MNLPNKLTMLRMVMIPFFIACFYIPIECREHIAAIIFILAYATDVIDGKYARKHNLVTDFGKLMDPIADKLLTASGTVHPIATFITIGREFVISGFRLVSASKGNVIAAGKVGKIKTVMQCVAVMLILIGMPLQGTSPLAFLLTAGRVALWISVALSIWSAVEYIVKNKGAVTSM